MNTLNKHRWGGGSVFSAAHDNIHYVPLWHCHHMWLLHTQMSLYTQVYGVVHRFIQHKCRRGSLCALCSISCPTLWTFFFGSSCASEIFWSSWKGQGFFFNNCTLCTYEMCGWLEIFWKEMLLQRDVPKKTKQTRDTNSQAIKSKRNQSLCTPRRIWVLQTEEDLPWGTQYVQLACLCPLTREQESKSKNTKSWKTVYEMNLEHRGTALELSFYPNPFFPNFVPKRKVDNI